MSTSHQISEVRALSRSLVRQLGLLENRFAAIGSVSQCHAIVELYFQNMLNLNQLSAALNLEKSTTSRLVTQLYDSKILTIIPAKNDRRNKLLSLTDKGKKFAHRINTQANLQVEQAFTLMTEEERNTVIKGLDLYTQALKNAQSKSIAPHKKRVLKKQREVHE